MKKLLFNLRNTLLTFGSKGVKVNCSRKCLVIKKYLFFIMKVLKTRLNALGIDLNYYCTVLLESCSHFCLLPSVSLVSTTFKPGLSLKGLMLEFIWDLSGNSWS